MASIRAPAMISAVCIVMLALPVGSCSLPPPAESGFVLSLNRPSKAAAPAEGADVAPLLVHWLGTASFHIRAGDTSVLTDPFYSHQTKLRTAFGQLQSNPQRIRHLLAGLPEPHAILVGHGHYDHLLDLAPGMQLRDWSGVEVFGSATVGNILRGYPERNRWRFIEVPGQSRWMTTSTPKLRIRTFSVGHAPQVGNRLLYPGRITEPLTTPPTRAKDFRAGDVLAYLVELDAGTKTYRVVFLSSTPTRHRELARELEASSPVDVLILPVASWEKVDGYPRTLIQALRPRYILLSHFNDFFGPRSPRRTLVLVDLDGMLREVQRVVSAEDDPEFEQIMVPDIKATLTLR